MTEEDLARDSGNEELWYQVFAVGAADLLDQRTYHGGLPSPPRCRMCKAPFAGVGGRIMRLKGKRPAKRNPHYCNACDTFLENNPGGAEVPMALLYADIRKSTEFVREHAPAEVLQRINTFLDLATEAITDSDGFFLAFYGDCVVANWPPGFSGGDYVAKAVKAGREIADASAKAGIPIGIGVHSGDAYMCSVQAAKGSFRDVSVFGEAVNIVARLSDAASAGEVLISVDAADSAGIVGAAEMLTLKGFEDPIAVRRLQS
jgi:adenylate cyclase